MRVFALSDVHVDYEDNWRWVMGLSRLDYRNDLLILAGDISNRLTLFRGCLDMLVKRFGTVLFVPGNHDLWVTREDGATTSVEKLERISSVVANCGVSMDAYRRDGMSIVPMFAWYDYSFGTPPTELLETWVDFRACRWPADLDLPGVTDWFLSRNETWLGIRNETVISFSHFVPRLDVMPEWVPAKRRTLYPVLGCVGLEQQIRRLNPTLHVYGHTHVNQRVTLDGVEYVNNAFGYPSEARITSKQLVCIHEA